MCDIMEKYLQEERIKAVQKLIKKGCDKEFIMDLDYTEDEYRKAEHSLRESKVNNGD